MPSSCALIATSIVARHARHEQLAVGVFDICKETRRCAPAQNRHDATVMQNGNTRAALGEAKSRSSRHVARLTGVFGGVPQSVEVLGREFVADIEQAARVRGEATAADASDQLSLRVRGLFVTRVNLVAPELRDALPSGVRWCPVEREASNTSLTGSIGMSRRFATLIRAFLLITCHRWRRCLPEVCVDSIREQLVRMHRRNRYARAAGNLASDGPAAPVFRRSVAFRVPSSSRAAQRSYTGVQTHCIPERMNARARSATSVSRSARASMTRRIRATRARHSGPRCIRRGRSSSSCTSRHAVSSTVSWRR